MKAVVGFEGAHLKGSHVAWGTAAVRLDERLLNPVTNLTSPIQDIDELAERGALFRFTQEVRLRDEQVPPKLVLAIEESSPYGNLLQVDVGRHGGIIKKAMRDGLACYILKTEHTLRQVCAELVDKIIRQVLSVDKLGSMQEDLIRVGLRLDPSHPELNALRVYHLGVRDHVRRLALARLRGERAEERFERMLGGLTSNGHTQEIRYQHGVASGGGLDVDLAARILRALQTILAKAHKLVRHQSEFLPQSLPPRFLEMQPGSARLVFATDRGERTLGDRVARYFELSELRRALAGEGMPELTADPTVEAALEFVAKPSLETQVTQVALGATASESVHVDQPIEDRASEAFFSILGFVTGALGDAGKLEVRVFPGARGRLLLPMTDDGEGNVPRGVELIQGRSEIRVYRLVVLDLLRAADSNGRERFYLQGLSFVTEDRGNVNAVPSSVVRGAFRRMKSLSVRLKGNTVQLGRETLPLTSGQQGAFRWLDKYRAWAESVELNDPKRGEWIRTSRALSPSALDRALVALSGLGGEALASDLAEEIGRRFDTVVRVNNTRREVLGRDDLLQFFGANDKRVRLTERGKLYVAAYIEAGGERGRGLPEA